MNKHTLFETFKEEISQIVDKGYGYHAIIFLLVVIITYGLLGFMEFRIRRIKNEYRFGKIEEELLDIQDRLKDTPGCPKRWTRKQ